MYSPAVPCFKSETIYSPSCGKLHSGGRSIKYDPKKHHRRSIRMEGYDYLQVGEYFVTICTKGNKCLFGDIADGKMTLNEPGWMIDKWWNKLPEKYENVQIDAYVVMPNHLHGIIAITANPDHSTKNGKTAGEYMDSPLQGLGRYVSWFKRMAANEYMRGVKQNGWRPFPGKLWQRNYYEHIIRNENEFNLIGEYIINNPPQWALDRENPAAYLERKRCELKRS